MSLLQKIRTIAKRDGNSERKPPALLPEQLPYPVQVKRRRYENEDVRKRGGVQVFDTPGALALNAARMDHLESLGLPLKGKRALDLGCGVGHLGIRLQQMGCSVLCVDGRAQRCAGRQVEGNRRHRRLAQVRNLQGRGLDIDMADRR